MSLPSLLLGFVLSTLLGAGFHAVRGGGGGKLLLDLVLGWLGFWLGQLAAAAPGLDDRQHWLTAPGHRNTGRVGLPFVGNWLSPVETPKKSKAR